MINREERIRDKAQRPREQSGPPAHHPERHRPEAERLVDAEDGKAGTKPADVKKTKQNEELERAVDIGPSPDGDITTVNVPPMGLPR